MTAADLERELLECLRAFWRMRAGLAVLRTRAEDRIIGAQQLEYANVPSQGVAANFLSTEPIATALAQTKAYENDRLLGDVFLMEIASFEKFLSAKLRQRGADDEGTLGALQKRAQKEYNITGDDVVRVDEIRERRNMLMHHAGMAKAAYVGAATNAAQLSGGHVTVPALNDKIAPTTSYITYVVDALVLYARRFP